MHQVAKFRLRHSSTRDKVTSFNEATKFWDADAFLKKTQGNPAMDDKNRQGRKLGISEYYQKMKRAHERVQ